MQKRGKIKDLNVLIKGPIAVGLTDSFQFLLSVHIFFVALSCDTPSKASFDGHREEVKGRHISRFPEMQLRFPGGRFSVEVADESHEQSLGYRFRKSIRPSEAMIFVFGEERQRKISMKNVHFPLQFALLNNEGKVLQIGRLEPEKEYSFEEKCRYILEYSENTSDLFQLKVGVKVIGLPQK
jgi:uncharacterized membrane protein (UPF0127 family)